MDLYLHQVIGQPLKYLMDVLYPYKIFSTPFLCMQIDEQKYRLPNALFTNQDIILSFRDLSSQIHSLNNRLPYEVPIRFMSST